MALCPFAHYRPVTKTRSTIIPRGIIYHTAVSNADSLYPYFSGSENDSHFYIRQDGQIEQYVDTEQSAYANVVANQFAISVETWDGTQLIPWNTPQLTTINRLNEWLAATHGIVRRQFTTPYGSGIGWHSMWGYNTPTDHPNPWTTANGKTCPGSYRIAQMEDLIIPHFINMKPPKGHIRMYTGRLAPASTEVPGWEFIPLPPVGDSHFTLTFARLWFGTGHFNELHYTIWFIDRNGNQLAGSNADFIHHPDKPDYITIPNDTAQISLYYTTTRQLPVGWYLEVG